MTGAPDQHAGGPGSGGSGTAGGPWSSGPGAERLRAVWEAADPVPAGLPDRVAFALQVEELTAADPDLELELMRLTAEQTGAVGSRGDQVRTVTFGSDSLTVMLALSEVEGGSRVDGWVAPGGRRRVQVRTAEGTSELQSDDTGRFAVPLVRPGHLQLVLDVDRARTVVTPALTL